MAHGKYTRPRKLKDENKWMKFFTIPQLFFIMLAVLLVGPIALFLSSNGMFPLGLFLFLFFVGATVGIVMFKVPSELYLFGADVPIMQIFLRILLKKIRKKKISTANYDETRRDS